LILRENSAANGALGLDNQLEKPEDFSRITAKLLRKDKKPSVNNRSDYRNRGRILTKEEERDLIRRAQAGDKRAETELLNRFHRLILKCAKPYVPSRRVKLAEKVAGSYQDHVEHEDLVAAGDMGLLKAIRNFDLKRHYRLASFAKKYIAGAISDEAQRWRLGDTQHRMTRLERWVASHPNDKPEWIKAQLSSRGEECSIEAIEAAQQSLSQRRSVDSYHTTLEGGEHHDYDNAWSNRAPVNPASSHDIHKVYDCFSPHQLTPHARRHKAISRTIDGLAKAKARDRLAKEIIDAPSISAASTYSTSVNSAYDAELPAGWDQDKDGPFWPEGSKWQKPRPEESDQSKERVSKGLQNGNRSFPRGINHALHGRALHQRDRGHTRDIRQGHRATGESTA
jgi:hypothetical protein